MTETKLIVASTERQAVLHGATPSPASGETVDEADGQGGEAVIRISLRTLALSFLKVGATGFGGGMAIIALMEDEVVRKHRAMRSDEFVTGVGLSQFLGAFPVNTAIFVGCRLYGLVGALASAVSFLLPSVSLVILLSFAYFHLHTLPVLDGVFRSVNAVVIALIVSAAWSLGRRVVHTRRGLVFAIAALIASVSHVHPVLVLLVAAVTGYIASARTEEAGLVEPGPTLRMRGLAPIFPLLEKLSSIGATFLKVGLFFFGGGFALIPLLQAVIVRQNHWLTPKEFLDGLALSSLTPGPIAVVATFIGYRKAGISGALTSTLALFLPGTVLMVWITRSYGHFRRSKTLQRVLEGINPATIGLVLGAGVILGKGSLTSWTTILISSVSLVLLIPLRWPPPIVVALGALLRVLHWV